jgi:hypothetical protein
MTMRKLLRRRSAMRELLQNLDTRPYCEDLPPVPGGWAIRPRPGVTRGSRCVLPASGRSDRR